jgi:two-component system, OmpR family, manganese sensing sensor histidine kinase
VALSDPSPDIDVQQKQFQVIERLTRRLGRLVDDLLFLARQESGLIALTPASVSLEGLLEDVLEEQQVMADERWIALRLVVPEDSADKNLVEKRPGKQWSKPPALLAFPPTASSTILGDPGQLTRLFTNLISNAVQYTPDGGTVTVQVKPTKHQGQPAVQVTVQDTGIGMDSEALAHAFDRFYRADPSRLRNGEQGTGLGLAIAKVIVDTHRGNIHLDSQPQAGTTVTVVLPQGGVGG